MLAREGPGPPAGTLFLWEIHSQFQADNEWHWSQDETRSVLCSGAQTHQGSVLAGPLGGCACMLETSQTPKQNGSRLLGRQSVPAQKILEFLNISEGLQLVSNCKLEAKELSPP